MTLHQTINPSECKFNVVANNMLIIIGKKREGIWKSLTAITDEIEKENIKGESLDNKLKDLSIQGNSKHLKEANTNQTTTNKIDLSGIKITNPHLFELD